MELQLVFEDNFAPKKIKNFFWKLKSLKVRIRITFHLFLRFWNQILTYSKD